MALLYRSNRLLIHAPFCLGDPFSPPVSGAHTVAPDESIGRQLVDPRAVRRHYDPMDLVSLAREVQTANQFVRATTAGKLQVIVDQIRHLQESVSSAFTKRGMHMYVLYLSLSLHRPRRSWKMPGGTHSSITPRATSQKSRDRPTISMSAVMTPHTSQCSHHRSVVTIVWRLGPLLLWWNLTL